MNTKTIAVALALALGGLVTSAQAAVIVYTDQGAFENAISGDTVHNFTANIQPGQFQYLENPLTLDGVTFASSGFGFVIDTAWSGLSTPGGSAYNWTDFIYSGQLGEPTNTVTATFSGSGLLAIGFNLGSYRSDLATDKSIAIELSSSESFSFTVPEDRIQSGFIGFISDTLLTSIEFQSDLMTIDIVDFITGTPEPTRVPEPATLSLLGLSLLGLGFARKHRYV